MLVYLAMLIRSGTFLFSLFQRIRLLGLAASCAAFRWGLWRVGFFGVASPWSMVGLCSIFVFPRELIFYGFL